MEPDYNAANDLVKRVMAGLGKFEHPSTRLLADAAWLATARAGAAQARLPLQLTLQTLTGRAIQVEAHGNWSTLDLFNAISVQEGIPVDQLRLLHANTDRQLSPHDAHDLHGQGITNDAVLTLVLRLRGGCYRTGFPFQILVTPGIDATEVDCRQREIVIDVDMRPAIALAHREEQRLASHPPFPGFRGPYNLERTALEHLDTLALFRIGLTCIRRTLTRREGTEVHRWDYDCIMVLALVLRQYEVPADICRRTIDAVVLPPEEWESGEQVALQQRFEMAALERGTLRLRASAPQPRTLAPPVPLLQPHRHYRVDLLDSSNCAERFFVQPFPRRETGSTAGVNLQSSLRSIASRSWHFRTGRSSATEVLHHMLPALRVGATARNSTAIPLTHEIGF